MSVASPGAASGAAHAPGAVWAARAYYFLFYGAVGVYYPYIILYYQQIGLSGQAMGLLASLLPVAIIVASPVWGAVGDRFRIHHYLLPLLTWAAILPTLALAFTRQLPVMAVLVAIASAFSAPLIPPRPRYGPHPGGWRARGEPRPSPASESTGRSWLHP